MIIMFLYYFIIGCIVGMFLETTIRLNNENVNNIERLWLVVLWPLMISIFIFYFIKHLFFIDNE
jgi:hypothetical protein